MPRGWKLIRDQYLCKKCKKVSYRVRAFELPVMGVLGADFAEFRQEVRGQLRTAAVLFNRGMREYFIAEQLPLPGEKVQKQPKVDPYKRMATGNNLGIRKDSVQCVFRSAQAHWSKHRFGVLTGTESLPLRRSNRGMIPVSAKDWAKRIGWIDAPIQTSEEKRTRRDEEGRPQPTRRTPYLDLNLTGEGGRTWRILLGRGHVFARQLKDFMALLDGSALPAELAVYERPCGQSRRNGRDLPADRAPGGGARQSTRIFVKFVASFPRTLVKRDCVMNLATHPEAFLVAQIDGRVERPWILNGDHLRGHFCTLARWRRQAPEGGNPAAIEAAFDTMRHWNPKHHAWLQRIGEDRKHEKRWPKAQLLQFRDAYRKRCDKFHRRMTTWLAQMAAQVAGFCVRRRVGTVVYDDSNKDWMTPFPWHLLRCRIQNALDNHGITLIAAASAAVVETVEA